jgi:argininosuccinate lyase
VTGTIATLELRADRCAAAIDESLMATELADLLVARGVPFRSAHEVVGRLLLDAEGQDRPLQELATEAWAELVPGLQVEEVAEALDARRAVARRSAIGGTAPESVQSQVEELRSRLAD